MKKIYYFIFIGSFLTALSYGQNFLQAPQDDTVSSIWNDQVYLPQSMIQQVGAEALGNSGIVAPVLPPARQRINIPGEKTIILPIEQTDGPLNLSPNDAKAYILYSRATLAYRNSEFESARKLYRDLIRRYPDSSYTPYALYTLSLSESDYRKKIRILLTIKEKFPQFAHLDIVLNALGDIYYILDAPDAANEIFEEAKTPYASYMRAVLAMDARKPNKAIQAIRDFLQTSPDNESAYKAYLLYAEALLLLKQYDNTLIVLEKAVPLRPWAYDNGALLLLYTGQAYFYNKNYNKALYAFSLLRLRFSRSTEARIADQFITALEKQNAISVESVPWIAKNFQTIIQAQPVITFTPPNYPSSRDLTAMHTNLPNSVAEPSIDEITYLPPMPQPVPNRPQHSFLVPVRPGNIETRLIVFTNKVLVETTNSFTNIITNNLFITLTNTITNQHLAVVNAVATNYITNIINSYVTNQVNELIPIWKTNFITQPHTNSITNIVNVVITNTVNELVVRDRTNIVPVFHTNFVTNIVNSFVTNAQNQLVLQTATNLSRFVITNFLTNTVNVQLTNFVSEIVPRFNDRTNIVPVFHTNFVTNIVGIETTNTLNRITVDSITNVIPSFRTNYRTNIINVEITNELNQPVLRNFTNLIPIYQTNYRTNIVNKETTNTIQNIVTKDQTNIVPILITNYTTKLQNISITNTLNNMLLTEQTNYIPIYYTNYRTNIVNIPVTNAMNELTIHSLTNLIPIYMTNYHANIENVILSNTVNMIQVDFKDSIVTNIINQIVTNILDQVITNLESRTNISVHTNYTEISDRFGVYTNIMIISNNTTEVEPSPIALGDIPIKIDPPQNDFIQEPEYIKPIEEPQILSFNQDIAKLQAKAASLAEKASSIAGGYSYPETKGYVVRIAQVKDVTIANIITKEIAKIDRSIPVGIYFRDDIYYIEVRNLKDYESAKELSQFLYRMGYKDTQIFERFEVTEYQE